MRTAKTDQTVRMRRIICHRWVHMLEDMFSHVVARTWIAQSSDHLVCDTYKLIRHFYKRTMASIIRLFGCSGNYTPQNKLRATSFISPLSLKCNPQNLQLFHGQNWKSQPCFNQLNMQPSVCNMFSYKRVNGTNNARPNDSKKNGNFQNMNFYPKMKFFHST